jgi:hypothetical protein
VTRWLAIGAGIGIAWLAAGVILAAIFRLTGPRRRLSQCA